MQIRTYRDTDLEACRELWVQLTGAHRNIHCAPNIGDDSPGRLFDAHLATVGREWAGWRDRCR